MEVQILWAMPVHLAQLVERQTFNLVVAGSSPAVDIFKTFDSKEGNSQVSRVWSKGSDLRSLAICFVGSNPTPDTVHLAQSVER
tara:strand:- start:93 stop:344 length:252 start_codon:yes stop_codon:yes gene_type:complete